MSACSVIQLYQSFVCEKIDHCVASLDRQWTMSCKTTCTPSTQKKEEFLSSTWMIIKMYLSWKIIIIFNKIITVKRLIFLITSTKYKHNDFCVFKIRLQTTEL